MNTDDFDTKLVRYKKVREGLTIGGLEAHIANAIILWNLGRDNEKWRGTQNDCQLVLSWVLRAIHQRMLTEKHYGKVPSTPDGDTAFKRGTGYHLEHAIPVACIMWALFNNVRSQFLPEAIVEVRRVIQDTMKVAYVSHEEHGKLNKKYSCTMPDEMGYPWIGDDVWARYTASDVKIPKIR